jgi:hypothetical protein
LPRERGGIAIASPAAATQSLNRDRTELGGGRDARWRRGHAACSAFLSCEPHERRAQPPEKLDDGFDFRALAERQLRDCDERRRRFARLGARRAEPRPAISAAARRARRRRRGRCRNPSALPLPKPTAVRAVVSPRPCAVSRWMLRLSVCASAFAPQHGRALFLVGPLPLDAAYPASAHPSAEIGVLSPRGGSFGGLRLLRCLAATGEKS